MKTTSFPLIISSLFTALNSPLAAVEAPEDNSSPPPAAAGKFSNAQLPEIKLQEDDSVKATVTPIAFLGVVSAAVPEMLATHLQLNSNQGVIVRSLVPDGPAAKAGLKMNDVIIRVADKAVGSPQEISEQITTHQPGDAINLDVIQKGKPAQLKVHLGTKPQDIAATETESLDPLQFDGIPKDLADRIRKAVEGNLRGLDLELGNSEGQSQLDMEEAMQQLRQRMQGVIGQGLVLPKDGVDAKKQASDAATIRMNDGKGSVEIKTIDGSKEVIIRDPQNHVVWNGPWDTNQDKEAAPAEVRERVETLDLDQNFTDAGLKPLLHDTGEPEN